MKRSTERILTTHTGSLPRPPQVVELMLHEQNKPGAKAAELKAAVRRAVADVIARQVACGLDVINDGEQGRTDYTTHVKDRLTGRWPELPAARHRRARLPRALGDARLFRLAVPASAGLLGPGQVEGLCRARGRHRAGQGGDGRRQSGGRLFHVAIAGTDRALPQEPALPERGSLSLRARRRDGARIPRHRGRWPRAAARLSGPGAQPPHGVRPFEPRRIPQVITTHVEALNH